MIEIRKVSEFDPKGDSICTDLLIVPCSDVSIDQIATHSERQIQMHVQGAVNEIQSEGCGPAKYAEVKYRGMCFVWEIEVHGQRTQAMQEAGDKTVAQLAAAELAEHLDRLYPAQEVTDNG